MPTPNIRPKRTSIELQQKPAGKKPMGENCPWGWIDGAASATHDGCAEAPPNDSVPV
jgi:hypothetical protein